MNRALLGAAPIDHWLEMQKGHELEWPLMDYSPHNPTMTEKNHEDETNTRTD